MTNYKDSVFLEYRDRKKSEDSINSLKISTSKSMESFYEDDIQMINRQIKEKLMIDQREEELSRVKKSESSLNLLYQDLNRRLLKLEKKCEAQRHEIEELQKKNKELKEFIFFKDFCKFLFFDLVPRFFFIMIILYIINLLI